MSLATPPTKFGLVDRATATGMTGLVFIQGLRDQVHPAPPITEAAGLWITEAERGRVVFEALPSARFYNPLGSVHGGWVSILLDSAMGCAVHSTLAVGQAFTTVDLAVSFVRPIFEETGRLRAEGTVVHVGRQIATAEGRVWDGAGRLLAHGSETCMVRAAAAAPA